MQQPLLSHAQFVDRWLEHAAHTESSGRHVAECFERGLESMWRRAQPTLGSVTLGAVVERVLCTARERYPALAEILVTADGMRFDRFHEKIDGLDRALVVEATRFALTEFLSVLGNLTAEILSPALRVALEQTRPDIRAVPKRTTEPPPAQGSGRAGKPTAIGGQPPRRIKGVGS